MAEQLHMPLEMVSVLLQNLQSYGFTDSYFGTMEEGIRETLMLLNTNDEHSFLSFNQDALNKFVVWYGDNLSEELGSEIVDTLDMLDERLEKTKYLYLSLPMILYAAVKCRREGKDFDKFVEKIKEFSSTYKDNESYRALLNGGTRSLQSVTSRYNYWNNIVENL